jgi:GAF domain-containing protein
MGQIHSAPSNVKRRVLERRAFFELIRMANRLVRPVDIAQQLAVLSKLLSDCQAVAIRMKDGLGFPYAASLGFPDQFARPEDDLFARDTQGHLVRDDHHDPVLACLCGQVLFGRVHPDHPLITNRGSFIMSSSAELLTPSSEVQIPGHILNLHHVAHYETVGLFPIRLDQQMYGLIQCNDKRPGRLTTETIDQMEDLAASAADLLEIAMP